MYSRPVRPEVESYSASALDRMSFLMNMMILGLRFGLFTQVIHVNKQKKDPKEKKTEHSVKQTHWETERGLVLIKRNHLSYQTRDIKVESSVIW